MNDIQAIDVHIHLVDEVSIRARGGRTEQMACHMGYKLKVISVDEMADQYRARKMMAVLMNTTDVSVTGLAPVPNDHIAAAVRKYPDVFLGFGIIDPWQGKLALQEIRRCKEELGLHGIGEFNPARQHFFPNDLRFYPLWEEIQKHGLPVLFHSSLAAAGAGTPGGSGTKLKYTQPIHLDDVACGLSRAANHLGASRPGHGRRKVSPSPATRATTTSTSPVGCRNIFPPD